MPIRRMSLLTIADSYENCVWNATNVGATVSMKRSPGNRSPAIKYVSQTTRRPIGIAAARSAYCCASRESESVALYIGAMMA